jgi:hypothetical protein
MRDGVVLKGYVFRPGQLGDMLAWTAYGKFDGDVYPEPLVASLISICFFWCFGSTWTSLTSYCTLSNKCSQWSQWISRNFSQSAEVEAPRLPNFWSPRSRGVDSKSVRYLQCRIRGVGESGGDLQCGFLLHVVLHNTLTDYLIRYWGSADGRDGYDAYFLNCRGGMAASHWWEIPGSPCRNDSSPQIGPLISNASLH